MSDDKQVDILIFVGGVSGVGKTTIARAIEERGIAVYKKIHEFALDIAKEKKVDIKTAFEQLDDSIITEKIIVLMKEYHSVVSDLHFAIQPKVDTIFLIGGKIDDETLMATEKYRPAFTTAELRRIINHNIILIPILITYDVDSLIRRRVQDTTRIPRSLKREIVQQECAAELETYLSITKQLGLQPQIFVNSDDQFNKFQEEVMAFLESKTKK